MCVCRACVFAPQGLEKGQMKIKLLSGDVKLKNLRVKPSALDFLHLPIKVLQGTVAHLSLQANWRKLTSKPVKIILEDVFVIAEPRDDFSIDEKVELRRALQRKLKRLAEWETGR